MRVAGIPPPAQAEPAMRRSKPIPSRATQMAGPVSLALASLFLAAAARPVFAPGEKAADGRVIRAEVRMVPVRIYATAPDGEPVPGLTAADFRLYDDGRPQTILTLIRETIPPAAAGPAAGAGLQESAGAAALPAGRSFLILLGFGGAEDPFGAVDALEHFLRENLRPADRVAVMFFDRVTEFTVRHDQVVNLLERYRRGRSEIETYYWQQAERRGLFRAQGLAAPPGIRAAADALFAGPDVPPSHRWVPEGGGVHELAKAIGLLRDQPEPRCLLYFADQGLVLPRLALVRGLANLATDARVAVFPFQTGGLGSGFSRNPLDNPAGSRGAPPDGALVLTDRDQLQAPASLEQLAEWTGGRASIHAGLPEALARLDRLTRSAYLLGYCPNRIRWDGRYHRIRVEALRPGVRVLCRQGYFATDREAQALTR